jgi:hypothetical protein
MMMFLMQQQQNKNKPDTSKQPTKDTLTKVNNYLDGSLTNQQSLDHLTKQKLNNIGLHSKFQSAPQTPTKVTRSLQESIDHAPKYIEINVITKYAFATRQGYIPNNPGKVNQDSFILSPNFSNCSFRHYFGVCDGHGQNGKEASHFIKLRLP